MLGWFFGVTLFLLFISCIGLTYQGWKTRIVYLEGIYKGGGTEAICSLVNSSITETGECILGGYYNDNLEFKRYRHHFDCSWGKVDVGATYRYFKVMERPIIWFYECEYNGFTVIDKPYPAKKIKVKVI